MGKWKIVDYCIELFGDACILVFSLWSVFCFYFILTKGWVTFIEKRTWIAVTELGMSVLIGILAIERMVRDMWKGV